ncbi:MAG: hypothetical protein KGO94_08635 [Alphaproteobacteria bacterium]|nr:hypothetical protein [Alphaproteobacteria bacterium]
MTKILMCVLCCLLLSGCILVSQTPLVKEQNGIMALKPFGTQFTMWNWQSGAWSREAGLLNLAAVGRHYETKNQKDKMEILFAALKPGWWIMQVEAKNSQARYSFLEVEEKAGELVLHPILCKDLAKLAEAKPVVDFVKNDCLAKPTIGLGLFKTLAGMPMSPMIKLVPEK